MGRPSYAPAKLSRPRLHDVVQRNRLFDELDDARRCPAVWVAAPPGAGKTTLAASWLHARGIREVWYQMDAGDEDVSTLFLYLREAARRRAPRGSPLPLLSPEYLADLAGFTRRFFRGFFRRLGPDGVLVLDNYLEPESGSLLHAAMRTLVAEIPEHCTLLVLSRNEPPADLARHLATRSLVVVGGEALRFTLDETRRAASGYDLPAAALDTLHERSGGWAAGLTLMLAQLRRGHMLPGAIEEGSREATFDYFAAEVFASAPEADRHALMSLAALPVVTPTLARRLTGAPDAARLLRSLHRRNLFIHRHPGPEPTYQFHALFREFLAATARQTWPHEVNEALSRRAAAALEEAGLAEHAFALYAETQQWQAAARLLLAQAPAMFAAGRWRTLAAWVGKLPAAALDAAPWLRYWLGWAQFQTDQAGSRDTLAQAYAAFEVANDRVGRMLTAAAILTGFYFEYVDWNGADMWIERLAALVQDSPALPTREVELSVYSALLYGMSIRQTNHPMLPACIERTVALLRQEAEVNARLQAGMAITGPVACMLGAFDLFREVRGLLAPLLGDARVTELNRACWHMTCGAKLSFESDFEDAYRELETGARVAREAGLRQLAFLSHHFEGLHAACFFDIERAEQAFTRAREWIDFSNPLQRSYLLWAETALAGARGDAARALDRARAAKAVGDRIGSAAHCIIASVFLATALVRAGERDEAERTIRAALAYGRVQRVPTWEATLLLLLAWCHHDSGEQTAARARLAEALARGKDGSSAYMRWTQSGARRMLPLALQEGIEVEEAGALVRRFRYPPDDPLLEGWPWPVRVYTLGRFEVQRDGRPLRFERKAPRRPLALLQCLIAHGGDGVSEHTLEDALWPDAEGDQAHQRLALTLHRLRQVLGDAEAIRVRNGKVSLAADRVWVDVLCLQRAAKTQSGAQLARLVATLHRGDFLPGEAQEHWLLPARERLRQLLRTAESPAFAARTATASSTPTA
jgi:ATP/maltotriose-dependent transcriptional regulator MalT